MERGSQWKERYAIQLLIDKAQLCDTSTRGRVVPWKDANGAGARPALLKAVLNALLTFYPNIHPSEAILAERSGNGRRSVQRAIAVLQAKDVLLVEPSDVTIRGGRVNKYTILATRLRQLAVQQRSLWNQRTQRHAGTDLAPSGHRPSAIRARPSATSGALTRFETRSEYLTKQGGAKELLSENREEVLSLAHVVRDATGELTDQQADQVIAICMLRVDDQITENSWALALASTRSAKPRDGFAYWRTCIRNQLADHGGDLESLLGMIGDPRALR